MAKVFLVISFFVQSVDYANKPHLSSAAGDDVLSKVKMFNQMASMTEKVVQEKLQKRLDYERRRSVFEKQSSAIKVSYYGGLKDLTSRRN